MNRRPNVTHHNPFPNCGLDICITSSECITRVCCSVVYCITVTNNCFTDVKCATLHIDLPEALAFECGTLEVKRHEHIDGSFEHDNLREICIGDLEEGESVSVMFRVTVMEPTRFVRTKAAVTCFTCCCCNPERRCFTSDVHTLQVCGCCCNDKKH